jgi:hypothetical protein
MNSLFHHSYRLNRTEMWRTLRIVIFIDLFSSVDVDHLYQIFPGVKLKDCTVLDCHEDFYCWWKSIAYRVLLLWLCELLSLWPLMSVCTCPKFLDWAYNSIVWTPTPPNQIGFKVLEAPRASTWVYIALKEACWTEGWWHNNTLFSYPESNTPKWRF